MHHLYPLGWVHFPGCVVQVKLPGVMAELLCIVVAWLIYLKLYKNTIRPDPYPYIPILQPWGTICGPISTQTHQSSPMRVLHFPGRIENQGHGWVNLEFRSMGYIGLTIAQDFYQTCPYIHMNMTAHEEQKVVLYLTNYTIYSIEEGCTFLLGQKNMIVVE